MTLYRLNSNLLKEGEGSRTFGELMINDQGFFQVDIIPPKERLAKLRVDQFGTPKQVVVIEAPSKYKGKYMGVNKEGFVVASDTPTYTCWTVGHYTGDDHLKQDPGILNILQMFSGKVYDMPLRIPYSGEKELFKHPQFVRIFDHSDQEFNKKYKVCICEAKKEEVTYKFI